ncbi:MAG: nucleobase:cation symporter, family [Frankiaceae bacterium]|jgi:putative hydroxymethylpyrimidine transporter CytX|nr:nucleobase:cation symporter, family [Frankiaceae bacterium]
MTATAERIPDVVDARGVEAPLTLEEPPPRVLGWLDQIALWFNLGVSLLGPVGAVYVLQPDGVHSMSFVAAALAVVVGTVVGTAMLAAAAVPGAQTGAPAMVLLRGLFGRRLSYLPTLINVIQLVGWAVFEIVVISQGAQQLLGWQGHLWPYVVVAGALTTLMSIYPLSVVRVLRRYALVVVALATAYLFVQLLRHPLPSLTHGGWNGFWTGTDFTVAVAVSFAPLASDYSRHARSGRSAFGAAMIGYSVAQIACYVLGLIALLTVVQASDANMQHDMFARFIAVPVGWLAFGALVARELDQSFADSYSTVVSLQNVVPRADRRLLAVLIGSLATVLALVFGIGSYSDFLLLLGSVLVPLTAVLLVDYFAGRRGAWNVSEDAPSRFWMVLPWLLGVAAYQLVNPGYVTWWADGWHEVAGWLHFTAQSWMSASLLSFVVAAVVTLPLSRRRIPAA